MEQPISRSSPGSNDVWSALLDEKQADSLLLDDFKIDSEGLSGVDFGNLPALDDSDLLMDTHIEGFGGLGLLQDEATIFAGATLSADPTQTTSGQAAGQGKSTPATSESGNQDLFIGAQRDDGGSGSGSEGGGHPSGKPDGNEDEAKRQARMQRNRENAYISRQRKKQQMFELQQQVSQYRAQNTQLTTFVQRLAAENCLLRHHLGTSCKKAGIPMPNVPSAVAAHTAAAAEMPSTSAPAGSTQQPRPGMINPLIPPMPAAAVTRPGFGLLSSIPMIPAGAMPRVQQQQQQLTGIPAQPHIAVPQPPAIQPESAATSASASAAAASADRQPRKRARTLTGAGAAFVTLFSIFMFVGPFIPGGTSSSFSYTQQPMLPVAHSSGMGDLSAAASSQVFGGRSGRALQSFQDVSSSSDSGEKAGLPAVLVESFEDDVLLAPTAPLAEMMNQTMEALLADPRSRKIQETAFQRLQELAPAAVLLDKDSPSLPASPDSVLNGGDLMEARNAFPLLAGSLFKGSGLQAPQTCEKVFEFDASSLPQNIRSRRSVEKFLMQSHGFKGRSLYGGGNTRTLPLPLTQEATTPTGSSSSSDATALSELGSGPLKTIDESTDLLLDENADSDNAVIPVGSPQEPLLVSVLLPANDSSGSAGLSVVDKVFVVLLNPQNRYVTYSCGLAKPLLV